MFHFQFYFWENSELVFRFCSGTKPFRKIIFTLKYLVSFATNKTGGAAKCHNVQRFHNVSRMLKHRLEQIGPNCITTTIPPPLDMKIHLLEV